MSTLGFTVSHARDARFTRGLRAFFEYRDLGIATATDGAVVAHVIRAVPGAAPAGGPHRHGTTFQLVYVLAGWIEFEYEGQGVVRLGRGSCVYQPPQIRHWEVGHSDDLELLEIVMPADFSTDEVEGVESAAASPSGAPARAARNAARKAAGKFAGRAPQRTTTDTTRKTATGRRPGRRPGRRRAAGTLARGPHLR